MQNTLNLPARPSRLEPLLRPMHAFLRAEAAGGVMLMSAAVVALIWANSPWGEAYQHFWHAKLSLGVNGHALSMSLEHWVNDGLMVIFFLLVGLEIKREIVIGELASLRHAALPITAAIGGMVVPALIYLSLNPSGNAHAGWGIPMATDIAFAIGVLALVGKSVPITVKIFLLAIAIADDLGAVLVIALFYTSSISGVALGIAGMFFAILIGLNLLRVHRPLPYMLIGVGLWIATLYSGVHATVAGVLLAFTIPATRQIEEIPYVGYMRQMLECFEREATEVPDRITEEQSHAIQSMEEASQAVQTPLARVEHALLRPVNLLIVPIFALANAGVDLRGQVGANLDSPVTWGVLLGLFFGKPVGVLLASWIAIKTGIASLPERATMQHIVGVAVLCGIGFTMSLFVANLAFPNNAAHLTAAKVGIMGASIFSGVVGGFIIMRSSAKDMKKALPASH